MIKKENKENKENISIRRKNFLFFPYKKNEKRIIHYYTRKKSINGYIKIPIETVNTLIKFETINATLTPLENGSNCYLLQLSKGFPNNSYKVEINEKPKNTVLLQFKDSKPHTLQFYEEKKKIEEMVFYVKLAYDISNIPINSKTFCCGVFNPIVYEMVCKSTDLFAGDYISYEGKYLNHKRGIFLCKDCFKKQEKIDEAGDIFEIARRINDKENFIKIYKYYLIIKDNIKGANSINPDLYIFDEKEGMWSELHSVPWRIEYEIKKKKRKTSNSVI